MSRVRVEVEDGVAVVTLDRPERRNAIDLALSDELVAAVREVESRAEVGAVVVTGAGSGFCAGADLTALPGAQPPTLLRLYEAFLCFARSPLPTVAAVNGPAVGAGMNLALGCDVRIAGRSARFVSRFLELGIHPGGGHTWMLSRLVGPSLASAMVLFGTELGGEEAARVGLASDCVDDDALMDVAVSCAARAAAIPRPLAMRAKSTLAAAPGLPDHAAAVEAELAAQVWSTQQPFYEDGVAAIQRRIGSGRSR